MVQFREVELGLEFPVELEQSMQSRGCDISTFNFNVRGCYPGRRRCLAAWPVHYTPERVVSFEPTGNQQTDRAPRRP